MYIPYRLRIEQVHSATTFVAARIPAEFAGKTVKLIFPSGKVEKAIAGTKPEYGPGGIEILTYEQFEWPAFGVIEFGNLVYTFAHPYGATILAFDEADIPLPTMPDQAAGITAVLKDAKIGQLPPLKEIEIVDLYGSTRDLSWLEANWGIDLIRTGTAEGVTLVSRIVKLVEREGPALQMVNVADADGIPMEGVSVIRRWPGAPTLPPYDPPTSRWYNNGVYGPTNMYGDWGSGMGTGDYAGPGEGVSSVWTAKPNVPSDLADKLHMQPNTNHRSLEVRFQIVPVQDDGEEDETIEQLLTDIRDLLLGGFIALPLSATTFAS